MNGYFLIGLCTGFAIGIFVGAYLEFRDKMSVGAMPRVWRWRFRRSRIIPPQNPDRQPPALLTPDELRAALHERRGRAH